jgi:hypothetical protein
VEQPLTIFIAVEALPDQFIRLVSRRHSHRRGGG